MILNELLNSQGAHLAADGIPLDFGDQSAEYDAALRRAVVMVRSHEGRLEITGAQRLDVMHRISTNDLNRLSAGQGAPTIFTSPVARILERATVFHRGERALVITEPGRAAALSSYLQRNIFFNDDARVSDFTAATQQFDLHGPESDAVAGALLDGAASLPPMAGLDATIAGIPVFMTRNKPVSGAHWTLVVPADGAGEVWQAIVAAGALPAGSLTYNALRIRAGRPGVGRELSQEYIPLEVGLWDEVSFQKGCYTGQEIIARMESRNKLARVMVRLNLDRATSAPADLIAGRTVGSLTSAVTTPDGQFLGIGVVKVAAAEPGQQLEIAGGASATIRDFAGSPPPMLAD